MPLRYVGAVCFSRTGLYKSVKVGGYVRYLNEHNFFNTGSFLNLIGPIESCESGLSRGPFRSAKIVFGKVMVD